MTKLRQVPQTQITRASCLLVLVCAHETKRDGLRHCDVNLLDIQIQIQLKYGLALTQITRALSVCLSVLPDYRMLKKLSESNQTKNVPFKV